MTTSSPRDPGELPLLPREEVEVRTHFDGTWVGGFEVVGQDNDRYALRRYSDGVTLPVTFRPDEIRRRPAPPRSFP